MFCSSRLGFAIILSPSFVIWTLAAASCKVHVDLVVLNSEKSLTSKVVPSNLRITVPLTGTLTTITPKWSISVDSGSTCSGEWSFAQVFLANGVTYPAESFTPFPLPTGTTTVLATGSYFLVPQWVILVACF